MTLFRRNLKLCLFMIFTALGAIIMLLGIIYSFVVNAFDAGRAFWKTIVKWMEQD